MVPLMNATPESQTSAPTTHKWWMVSSIVLIIVVLIAWSIWPRPTQVDVVRARRAALVGQLSATGQVEGRLARIGAKAGGEVEQVYVEEAEVVAEGTPLARISPGPSSLAASSAELLNLQVIESPFAGVVARRYVDPGDATVPGQALFAVVDPDQVWIVAYVNDVDLPRLQVNMPVQVSLPAYLSCSYAGEVVSINQLAEPRSKLESGARTVRARIELTEPMPGLVPGVEVNVDAQVTLRSEALLIPADAVVEEDSRRYVWLVRGARAQRQDITTGANNYLAVEVLDGLTQGDLVVVTEKDKLEPSQAVRPIEISVPLSTE